MSMSMIPFVLFRFLNSGIFAWLLYICLQAMDCQSSLRLLSTNYLSESDEDIESEDGVRVTRALCTVRDINVQIY